MLKTPLSLIVTTILGILGALFLFIGYGIGLHYHPDPTALDKTLLIVCPLLFLLPVAILWVFKWRAWSGIMLLFLRLIIFIFGATIAVYFGYQALTDTGDAFMWLPISVYGLGLIYSLEKIRWLQRQNI